MRVPDDGLPLPPRSASIHDDAEAMAAAAAFGTPAGSSTVSSFRRTASIPSCRSPQPLQRRATRRSSVIEANLKASATDLQLRRRSSITIDESPGVKSAEPQPVPTSLSEIRPGGPLDWLKAEEGEPSNAATPASLRSLQPNRTGKYLWGLVKDLLWRLVNPSVGFAHMVRRALFTERCAKVLQTMPAFEKSDINELYGMISSAAEIFVGRCAARRCRQGHVLPDTPRRFRRRYKVLYREGAKAQNMYILLEGRIAHTSLVSEVTEALRLQACTGTGSDGVHGLPVGQETLTNVSRMTTACAVTNCRLLQFSALDLGLSRDAVMREFVRGEIKAIPLFDGVDPDTFERLVPLMDCIEIDAVGTDIIIEGKVPVHLCILAHGAVDIVLKNGLCVAKLTAHAPEKHNSYPFFGEMGLLASKAAMANVRAASACKILTVSRANVCRIPSNPEPAQ